MEIMVSLSALPPSMYRKYRKGWKPNPTLLGIFEKISGKKGHKAMRIYIDAKTDNVVKTIAQNIKPPIQIVDALMEKDIVLVDYLAGTGKDSHGRIVKIGRALSKMPELKKMFDSDPNRKSMVNATRNHQLICISMHPYDIAGMSTDRGWVSCMDLNGGSNKHYIKHDINGGTLVAYLIDPQDKNINKPIARCLAKPFFQKSKAKASEKFVGSETVNALYLVEYAYPDNKMPFVHTLQEWLNEKVNPFIATTERKGVYQLSSKLYADTRGSTFDYDIEGPILRGDIEGFVTGLLDKPSKDSENIALDHVERYPQIATMLLQRKWGVADFYGRCVREMIRAENYDELQNFFVELIKQFALNTPQIDKVWTSLSGRPKPLLMFIDALPKAQRDSFLSAHLGDMDFYTDRNGSMDKGGYPAALSEIWSLSKFMPNPEHSFWFNASRINVGGTQTKYVDEEFEGQDSSPYREYVLVPAVSSFVNQDPKCPAATRESLVRNKEAVSEAYYDTIMDVFNGATLVSFNDRLDLRPLVEKMLETLKVKPKLKTMERRILARRLDMDFCLHQAANELYPEAQNLARAGLHLLVDSPMSADHIKESVVNRALELSRIECLSELEDMRE